MAWNNGGSDNSGGDGPSDGRDPPADKRNPWGLPTGDEKKGRREERPRETWSHGNAGKPGGQWGPSRGPWGGGGGRGPGGPSPEIDEMIARAQRFVRNLLSPGGGGSFNRQGGRGGGKFGGSRGMALAALALAAIWLGSGFYRVQPDEQGVVLRFGAYERTTLPGLNYHLPWPIETVLTPAVTRINRVDVGYRVSSDLRGRPARDGTSRDVPEESLMLTGDENIIDIDCAVFWRVRDAGAFLFATRNPDETVKSAAESVLREVIGRTPIQPALTNARAQVEAETQKGLQAILDQYGGGVEITQVQLQKVDPPAAVIDSFRDVQRANTDAERLRNEAESYRNDIVPRARGEAASVVAEAEGARQASIAEATGQAQRFLSVLKAYDAAKDVTLQRLYLETMQAILTRTPATVVDDRLRGVVPFLPLGGPTSGPFAPPAGQAPRADAPQVLSRGTP